MKNKTWIVLAALLAVAPLAANAHPGHVEHLAQMSWLQSLLAGFSHPFTGLDHLLAMLGVGALAFRQRGARIAPLVFNSLLALGGLLGLMGFGMPFIEGGIAISLIVVAAALAFGRRFDGRLLAFLVGGFGVFHGVAHGMEMPTAATGELFLLGMLLGSCVLQCVGAAVAMVLQHSFSGRLMTRP